MVLFITITTVLILLLVAVCAKVSFSTKTTLSVAVGKFEIAAFFSILFCSLIYISKNAFSARLMLAFYCGMMDISMFAMLQYLFAFENEKSSEEIASKFKIAFLGLMVIDFGLLIYSVFKQFYFSVNPVVLKNGFSTWVITFNEYIIFHNILCYCVCSTFLFKSIRIISHSPRFYKSKFVVSLTLFLIELICNSVFMINPSFWIFDFSSLTYGFFVIVLFNFSLYSVPIALQKRVLANASESVSDAIICFDSNNTCIYMNKVARSIAEDKIQQLMKSYIEADVVEFQETIKLTINDEVRIYKSEFHKTKDIKDRYVGSYIKLTDCTLERNKIEQEEYRSTHDALTGLYNREYFFREAQKILYSEPDVPRYLVATDIKKFKMLNDLFGENFGDSLLKVQTEMLRETEKLDSLVGRVSGDKFAMLIEKSKFNPPMALKNTEKIKNFTNALNFPLAVHLGVYEISDPYENVRSMYDKACLAIKNIENKNKTALAVYDSSLMYKLMDEKNIVSKFDSALEEKQFELYLQSQIDSKTGECLGAEALARWNSPERGIRGPAEFISILERSGQIFRLDQYIWTEAVKLLKKWKEKGFDKYISINISVRDFYYSDVYAILTGLVEEYGVEPSKLNLEITESILTDNKQYHKNILEKFRNYGFRVEMDDFGSGYSSLNMLKDMEMDVLKIDMGFLSETENSDRAFLVIKAVCKLAKTLGMEIIVEGVETQEQAETLKQFNPDYYQGFLFSKPVSVKEFEEKYGEGKL